MPRISVKSYYADPGWLIDLDLELDYIEDSEFVKIGILEDEIHCLPMTKYI